MRHLNESKIAMVAALTQQCYELNAKNHNAMMLTSSSAFACWHLIVKDLTLTDFSESCYLAKHGLQLSVTVKQENM